MIKIDLKQRKREVLGVIVILFVIVTGMSIYKYASFSSGFEITDRVHEYEKSENRTATNGNTNLRE